ncbi:hypothetical protein JHK85_000501 [Glycine max]|uniref:Uncharacterized protein n=1 Tax=Glycine max TaxID=3847 RepID=A0A0R0LG64_SOYBN|nr:hypothetical protein JHK85_000501 [Glycine max]KAG5087882.1 hypothetical protein JHK86_000494 [Glycine max]KAH1161673.1 hypothetical protein GYH30_000524 [Glycine max]
MTRKEEEPNWMTPYKNFTIRGELLPNKNKAQHFKRKASYYVIFDGKLFKKGLTTPLLKCLNNQQVNYVMKEIYERIYGLHTGGRSLTSKVV